MDHSLLYWLFLYLSYVLLPVIPAVIIYKIFPHTQVGVSHVLRDIKINAAAAFGAYIVSTLLGVFVVRKAFAIIEDTSFKTWTVTSNVRFVDENNQPLSFEADELDKMASLTNIVLTLPPDSGSARSNASFQFKIASSAELPCVSYTNGDFIPAVIDLDTVTSGKRNAERKINLGTIYLKKPHKSFDPLVTPSFARY